MHPYLRSSDVKAHPDKRAALITAGTSAVLSRTLPGFNCLVGAESQPNVILNALRAVSEVKVLSTPSIVVLNNQIANFQVGDQVPVSTATRRWWTRPAAPVVNSVDYRNTGIILRVQPRINSNGNVVLDIEQEISNVAVDHRQYPDADRVAASRQEPISVTSGQTVLLAGLISEQENLDRKGIPLSIRSPRSATCSQHQDRTKVRTELIIFIRPQIIRARSTPTSSPRSCAPS